MSEPVLGKRARNGAENDAKAGPVDPVPTQGQDDDSDDDVGPMPIPADAEGSMKKKRKGERLVLYPHF